VIEGGARLFHPVTKEIENNPEITLEAFKALMKLQQEWVPEICKRFPELVPYPGKTAYVTLEVHPHTARMSLEEYYEAVKNDLQGMEQEGLIVIQRSQIAIDIGAAGKEGPINKGSGMRLLAQKMGVHPRQMLALGDSMSDYSMIQEAGFAACPSNATEEFQRMTLEQGGFVSSRPYVEGVVDAIRHFCRG
jgi:hydroxymethylpyrimidine pyrophosphatase-like HAD family hydrolase